MVARKISFCITAITVFTVYLSGKRQNNDIRRSYTSYKHFYFTGDEVDLIIGYLNDDVSERW